MRVFFLLFSPFSEGPHDKSLGHDLPLPGKLCRASRRKSPGASHKNPGKQTLCDGMKDATSFGGNLSVAEFTVSLNGIMSSALSALQTNTEALRITSNNIANMNTQGYARRIVNEGDDVAPAACSAVWTSKPSSA